ncbi:phytanoyl-CoA dioxygenase family protein [Pseudomonadales bacterium]|nr:phytanoyl-CoA dioxygenase family protein [Pseudomonadales bacterium]
MKLHPLNQNFSWQQPVGPFTCITQAQADAYAHQGGFVLPDVFSPAELTALLAELDPLEAEKNALLQHADPNAIAIAKHDEIVFRAHTVLQSPQAKALASHPTMLALVKDLIGPAVRLYWDQIVYKRPGTPTEFPWHQDNGYTFVQPQQYLTCWIALNDAVEENGCPWIAPGLHTLGTLNHWWADVGFQCLKETPEDAVAMPLKAGSIAVFSSLTPHRTGPNLTANTRKAYILQYAPDGAVMHHRTGETELAADQGRQFLVT